MFFRYNNLKNIKTAILKTEITDHFAILSEIRYNDNNPVESKTDRLRTSYTDYKKLTSLIADQTWDDVFRAQDADVSTNTFYQILNQLTEKAKKPLKPVESVKQKQTKPWITTELINAINIRDKMSKKLKKQRVMISNTVYMRT
ncbi:MAG: hypothetical protein ACL7AX_09225 [Candidatus Arsenophonus phytopathogenicus]